MTIYLPKIERGEHEHTSNPKLTDWWRWSKIYPSKTDNSEDLPNLEEVTFENWLILGETEVDVEQKQQRVGTYYLCTMAPYIATFVIPDNAAVAGAFISGNVIAGGSFAVGYQFPGEYVVSQRLGGIPVVLAPAWDRRIERAAAEIGLCRVQIPYELDERVLPLLDRTTLEAASIITNILSKKISEGLPANHVRVESLVDYDAGQWAEIVFTIHVNLNSEEANREWDDVLATVSEIAKKLADREVATSLLERIGIHFTWVATQHV